MCGTLDYLLRGLGLAQMTAGVFPNSIVGVIRSAIQSRSASSVQFLRAPQKLMAKGLGYAKGAKAPGEASNRCLI
jgi:hypothetical protein